FDRDIAEMQEMHAFAKALHHSGQVVVTPGAKRAGAKGDAVSRDIDCLDDLTIIVFRRHDAWQPQQRERRVVRVTAQTHAEFFGKWRYFRKKINQMPPQSVGADIVVFGQMLAYIGKGKVFGGTWQAVNSIGRQFFAP